MGIILTIIGLVLCVFFIKSIVRIIVWLFGFLVRNFIYVIIIVLGACVKSKFSAYNFKKIRIPQFSETRFGSFVGLFSCFYVYKQ